MLATVPAALLTDIISASSILLKGWLSGFDAVQQGAPGLQRKLQKTQEHAYCNMLLCGVSMPYLRTSCANLLLKTFLLCGP
jgi:hypothetical protein